jgi:hypothetical protein
MQRSDNLTRHQKPIPARLSTAVRNEQATRRYSDETALRRSTWLLAALAAYLLAAPALEETDSGVWLVRSLFTALLVSTVWAFGGKRRSMIVVTVLAVPSLVFSFLVTGPESRLATIAAVGAAAAFIGYSSLTILQGVLRARVVNRHVIEASVAVYGLLGLLWACLFTIVAIVKPGALGGTAVEQALAGADAASLGRFSDFVYYSFTTLTTLGYGDIAPVDGFARMLAILEAIVGQIYIAVIIARLVGVHVATASVQGD